MSMDLRVMEDGRWVIGKRTASACPDCGAKPDVTHAQNGRAEVWHRPFMCCAAARDRNARLRLDDEVAKEERQWRNHEAN